MNRADLNDELIVDKSNHVTTIQNEIKDFLTDRLDRDPELSMMFGVNSINHRQKIYHYLTSRYKEYENYTAQIANKDLREIWSEYIFNKIEDKQVSSDDEKKEFIDDEIEELKEKISPRVFVSDIYQTAVAKNYPGNFEDKESEFDHFVQNLGKHVKDKAIFIAADLKVGNPALRVKKAQEVLYHLIRDAEIRSRSDNENDRQQWRTDIQSLKNLEGDLKKFDSFYSPVKEINKKIHTFNVAQREFFVALDEGVEIPELDDKLPRMFRAIALLEWKDKKEVKKLQYGDKDYHNFVQSKVDSFYTRMSVKNESGWTSNLDAYFREFWPDEKSKETELESLCSMKRDVLRKWFLGYFSQAILQKAEDEMKRSFPVEMEKDTLDEEITDGFKIIRKQIISLIPWEDEEISKHKAIELESIFDKNRIAFYDDKHDVEETEKIHTALCYVLVRKSKQKNSQSTLTYDSRTIQEAARAIMNQSTTSRKLFTFDSYMMKEKDSAAWRKTLQEGKDVIHSFWTITVSHLISFGDKAGKVVGWILKWTNSTLSWAKKWLNAFNEKNKKRTWAITFFTQPLGLITGTLGWITNVSSSLADGAQKSYEYINESVSKMTDAEVESVFGLLGHIYGGAVWIVEWWVGKVADYPTNTWWKPWRSGKAYDTMKQKREAVREFLWDIDVDTRKKMLQTNNLRKTYLNTSSLNMVDLSIPHSENVVMKNIYDNPVFAMQEKFLRDALLGNGEKINNEDIKNQIRELTLFIKNWPANFTIPLFWEQIKTSILTFKNNSLNTYISDNKTAFNQNKNDYINQVVEWKTQMRLLYYQVKNQQDDVSLAQGESNTTLRSQINIWESIKQAGEWLRKIEEKFGILIKEDQRSGLLDSLLGLISSEISAKFPKEIEKIAIENIVPEYTTSLSYDSLNMDEEWKKIKEEEDAREEKKSKKIKEVLKEMTKITDLIEKNGAEWKINFDKIIAKLLDLGVSQEGGMNTIKKILEKMPKEINDNGIENLSIFSGEIKEALKEMSKKTGEDNSKQMKVFEELLLETSANIIERISEKIHQSDGNIDEIITSINALENTIKGLGEKIKTSEYYKNKINKTMRGVLDGMEGLIKKSDILERNQKEIKEMLKKIKKTQKSWNTLNPLVIVNMLKDIATASLKQSNVQVVWNIPKSIKKFLEEEK